MYFIAKRREISPREEARHNIKRGFRSDPHHARPLNDINEQRKAIRHRRAKRKNIWNLKFIMKCESEKGCVVDEHTRRRRSLALSAFTFLINKSLYISIVIPIAANQYQAHCAFSDFKILTRWNVGCGGSWTFTREFFHLENEFCWDWKFRKLLDGENGKKI